jgi:hypothetical protein
MLAMPLFIAVVALVTDGSNLMVKRRSNQNAADAVALAIAQDIVVAAQLCNKNKGCLVDGRDYLVANGINVSRLDPAWHGPCSDADRAKPTDTNCFAYPYYKSTDPDNPLYSQVEVRLKTSVDGFFTSAVGLASKFNVRARAVAGASPVTETHCVFPDPQPPGDPDQYLPTCQVPGTPDQSGTVIPGINGSQAFTMSPNCDAILYTGNGQGTVAALATNGGLLYSGNKGKKVDVLGFNETRCPRPAGEPSGQACTDAAATGKASCVVNPIDFGTSPFNWPYPPPPTPTPTSLPQDTPYPLSWYPTKCIDLGAASQTFSSTHHPPGIYCIRGSSTVLNLRGDLTGGAQGYTFFALGGASISVGGGGSGAAIKFYWPSSCGARPTDRTTFSCNGVSSGYDPQALLYASSTNSNQGNCAGNAICISGGSSNLTGDVFAPLPTPVFPPGPASNIGAGVFIAGNNAVAGSGFFESWFLTLQGTTGTYAGTGPVTGARCVFPDPQPPGDPNQYLPDCIVPGSTAYNGTPTTTVTGSIFGLDD